MTAELGIEDQPPQLVPLNAIFATDFVQILVPVTTANTMREVAAAVAHHVEGRRVRALPYEKVVIYQGKRMPPTSPSRPRASSRSTMWRSNTTSRRVHEEPGRPHLADG
jgi:toluene monooxygenase system protein B